ncbi:MAG TPA: hypothetical protein VHX44_15770 [Planctomycetota bacterium]|nr:hypothetical protein [Planctomycetota bacterium]
MKHPVKTLAALAILGAVAPSAHAMSIKDDVVSLKLTGNIQFRASLLNDASDTGATAGTSGDYDPLRGTSGQSAEAARFDIRRARLGFVAKMGDWTGNITLRAEKNDTSIGANGGRAVQLYYANIARDFKEGDMVHQIRMGLDKSFHAESTQSSSTFLFPTDTIVDEKVEKRGVGIGYRFNMPFLHFGADLHNNSTGTKDGDFNNAASGDTNGLFYSARIEFAPGAEFMPDKRMHSFYGKEGTHLVIGLDAQWDMGNLDAGNTAGAALAGTTYSKKDTFTWGPDVLFHWNGLTALAELRMRSASFDDTNTANGATDSRDDLKSMYWDIQAGYTFPTEYCGIEPAIGYMVTDNNTDNDNEVVAYTVIAGPASIDNGASGTTLNVDVNFYWNGHDNKTQIAYQNWKAEDGDGDASIIRIQHQINF